MAECGFSKLSDDVILTIINKLDQDPRHWARISCVSTRFAFLIRSLCFRSICSQSIPAVVSDLLPSDDPPPYFWTSLYKLAVCCPGLLHSGVLTNSNFRSTVCGNIASSSSSSETGSTPNSVWSLYDDLLFDTLNNGAETPPAEKPNYHKRRRFCRPDVSHLASGIWNLRREPGSKLLASRFKADRLYICDWPGCVHVEEKRNYMLFRGVFKNFKESRVWRTISEVDKNKIDMTCVYCQSKNVWDLLSAFCLRRYFGHHDDGEPMVRAYVCEHGHVSGAWTDWPLYV